MHFILKDSIYAALLGADTTLLIHMNQQINY